MKDKEIESIFKYGMNGEQVEEYLKLKYLQSEKKKILFFSQEDLRRAYKKGYRKGQIDTQNKEVK